MMCEKCGSTMRAEVDHVFKTVSWHCDLCGEIKYMARKKRSLRKNDNIMEIILTKLCDMVGLSILDVDFSDRDYRTKTFWSEYQKEEFRQWLLKFLNGNNKAQVYLFKKRLSKKDLEKKVDKIVEKLGWISEKDFLERLRRNSENGKS
jgi:hypothetical protein